MAKRQLKQNQVYLIKLKIVKVVTDLEGYSQLRIPTIGKYSNTVFDRPTLLSF